jgi:ammonium transporter, Amt family
MATARTSRDIAMEESAIMRFGSNKGRGRPAALLGLGLTALTAATAFAEDAVEEVAYMPQASADVMWLVLAAVLVLLMQAGFAMLETGLTRAKSACNIMMKNLMDFSLGALCFWAIGYALMYGSAGSGWIGWDSAYLFLGHAGSAQDPAESAGWFFQVVFAATAATIVSGAIAERARLTSYLIYAVVLTAIIYPISGSWIWGANGWLGGLGMRDFAGSTVVHSVGGWAALAGALVIGPRTGKYGPNGEIRAIPGHNMPLAALGVFILFFGWFGFNAGSTLAAVDGIAHVAVTTSLAAAAGSVAAMFTSWARFGKPDLSMALNGCLGGLVGITAPCASVSTSSAVLIGAVAGVIVVLSVLFFDRVLKIDDPVGAISVHGICGVWGTLAVGLFGSSAIDVLYWDADTAIRDGLLMGGGFHQFGIQLLGVIAVFAYVFTATYAMFWTIKKTVGLRITVEEERLGVDIVEHGNEAYPADYMPSTPPLPSTTQ